MNHVEWSDVIIIGPGLGSDSETAKLVLKLVKNAGQTWGGHKLTYTDVYDMSKEGKLRLKIIEAGKDFAEAEVVIGGRISDHKGVNIPNAALPISSLSYLPAVKIAVFPAISPIDRMTGKIPELSFT